MQEPAKDKKTDKVRKPAEAPSRKRVADELTCSESQIEDIFSEGESTKPMGKTGKGLHEKRQPKLPL
jgi:membrane protein involved in colicin uptake